MESDHSVRMRLTNIIFATQSMFSAGQIAIITLLSIVAVEISGREGYAGVPSTILTVAQALTALPLGLVMGRFGRRIGLSVSYSVSAIGALLGVIAILQNSFWLLLASSALLGSGRAGGDQSRFAAGDMFPEGERARMIGRVVFAGTIGAIFGPLLVVPGSRISAFFGLLENTGPWLIGLVLYIIAALVTLFFLVPDPISFSTDETDSSSKEVDSANLNQGNDGGRSLGQLFQQPTVQLAVLSMLVSQAVMVGLMVITPVHMQHHDHGKSAVSIVIMAHTLGMFGLSGFTGYLIDRLGMLSTMIIGGLILIISAIISPMSATMPILIIGLFLLGLGWNFCYISGSALLSSNLKGIERNRIQGTSDMLVAVAASTGSLGSGPIFGSGDYVAVAIVGIVIVVLFLLISWILHIQMKSRVAFS